MIRLMKAATVRFDHGANALFSIFPLLITTPIASGGLPLATRGRALANSTITDFKILMVAVAEF